VILIIDNYDSFTWNLVQRLGEIDTSLDIRVVRNDRITPDEALELAPERLIISPGPCTPAEAGVSPAMIEAFSGKIPVLGVCLGHQCIGATSGMTVARHPRLMHGKTSEITHDGRGVFAGLASPMTVMRYHSLVVLPETVDRERFEISATCVDTLEDGREVEVVMGLRRRAAEGEAPLEGVQFHPESFMTLEGPAMLANFLELPAPTRDAASA
jgi:anthranilate synthase/aminodeoxychorismate synthase-like glutamine amidotransferase